jgi:hypothetical protein
MMNECTTASKGSNDMQRSGEITEKQPVGIQQLLCR